VELELENKRLRAQLHALDHPRAETPTELQDQLEFIIDRLNRSEKFNDVVRKSLNL
jgi:hypothetical protein